MDERELKALTASQAGAPVGLGSRNPKQGIRMLGSEALIASLEAEGVEIVFGYPGGQAMMIYDALYDSKVLRHVLARHEQGAVHEADGYARATGNVGVVLVTSGPGATNTVTGIATAYMDSIPLVVITGQVPRAMIGTDSFQESDIVGISMPVVKHSFLLQSVEELASTVRKAFHIAKTGRPGPVLIDVPSDVVKQEVLFKYPDSVDLPSYRPTYKGNAKQIKAAVERIRQSKRPVILAGGGVIASKATEQVLALSEMCRIPVVTTLMAKGAVPESNAYNLGMVGMHGSKYANMALNRSDLIIVCGARFSDRVVGNFDSFAPDAEVIHIDIDPAEIGKTIEVKIPIVGNLAGVLDKMIMDMEKTDERPDTTEWLAAIQRWRERFPLHEYSDIPDDAPINPETALAMLSDMIDPNETIITTEVGQHQMWAAQCMKRERPRTFLTSGGLGTMGFGFPAAIGAGIGCPDKGVICIAGDGSFQMNLQEMATATANGVPVKVVVVNNLALGMVRQWQNLFCKGRICATELEDTPDFVMLANAYGWQADRVQTQGGLREAFEKMLACDGPYLLDMRIPSDCYVFPMVAPGKTLSEMMGVIDTSDQESEAGQQGNDGEEF